MWFTKGKDRKIIFCQDNFIIFVEIKSLINKALVMIKLMEQLTSEEFFFVKYKNQMVNHTGIVYIDPEEFAEFSKNIYPGLVKRGLLDCKSLTSIPENILNNIPHISPTAFANCDPIK
jgi:hypothetical protein